jgi:thymidylate synthase ThyX
MEDVPRLIRSSKWGVKGAPVHRPEISMKHSSKWREMITLRLAEIGPPKNPTKINVKTLLDSVSEQDHRLTTLELEYPRFIHSELMTHRVFSRNAASSRAISMKKSIQRVKNDPAMPVFWPVEVKGMAGVQEMDEESKQAAITDWLRARDAAVHYVEAMTRDSLRQPLHKSLANRLLEPFMWMKTIVSATEWANFIRLRTEINPETGRPMAMPEFYELASLMQIELAHSIPKLVKDGEWHLPLLQHEDFEEAADYAEHDEDWTPLKKISAGKCGRVSYLTHDGVRDVYKDIELCEGFIKNEHASPLEHVATPCRCDIRDINHLGNFSGWDQFRHEVIEEDYTYG